MVLAVAWAVYLIPKALRHHDEVARTRSIDRFSTAMRVLARREPVNRRDTRLVVTPARPARPRILVPTSAPHAVAAVAVNSGRPATAKDAAGSAGHPASQRSAAQAAARRRHLLIFFVLTGVAMAGVAAFGYAPWWAVAIPGGLTLAYLFLCRFQVSRERRVARATQAFPAVDSAAPRRGVRVEAPYAAPRTLHVSHDESEPAQAWAEGVDATGDAVPVPAADGGSLWDPLPMTLPTYVSKPRAARTVRTIDLSQPNTWSSGRSEADSKLVEETVAAREVGEKEADEQRAVGS